MNDYADTSKLKPPTNNVELKNYVKLQSLVKTILLIGITPEIDLLCGYSPHDERVGVIEPFAEVYNWDDPELEDFIKSKSGVFNKGDLFVYFKNNKVDLNYHEFILVDVTIFSAYDLMFMTT